MTLWTWDRLALAWAPVALPTDRPYALGPTATLVPLTAGRYGVLASGWMRVNGEPTLPLRVLDDRDELQLPGGPPHYVSVDGETVIAAFPAGAGPTRCGRCGSPLDAGAPSVRCPRCHVTCHETPVLPCWSHSDTCPACAHPTRGFSWQPAPLASPPADGQTGAEDV